MPRATLLRMPFQAASVGTMWGAFFTDTPVTDYATAKTADTARYPISLSGALIDPDGLRQVLWNVLLNAGESMRALPPPERVIDCGAQAVIVAGPTPRIRLTVADRGHGVPAALRRRVFAPFFSTKARGTGLGLSVCKQILEDAGGRIRLAGRPGGGTRVVVELRPAEPPA